MHETKTKCQLIAEMVELKVTSKPASGLSSTLVVIQRDASCSHDGICERYGWHGCKAKRLQAILNELHG